MSGSESFGSGERFYHGVCPVTLQLRDEAAEDGVTCPRCGLVWYADPAALEAHRASHAAVCGLVTKLVKAAGGRNPLGGPGGGACLQLANIAKLVLRRSLTQFESDLLMFPRTCSLATCSAHLGGGPATVCGGCGVAVYCDKSCQAADTGHCEYCEELRTNREDYLYTRTCTDPPRPNQLAGTRLPRPPATMEEAVTALGAGLELATPRGRHTSALLSSPLTVLAALSAAPELRSRPHLTVHCVGSRRIEAASAWSLLLSLAPGLTSVTLIFVGLEVVVPATQDTRPGLQLVHLPPCAYHEYAASPDYTEPDLVAALNCGFILYSSWAASLPAMVRASGAPLVFTEYYEQDCRANLDLVTATLQGGQVEVVQEVARNPFRSRVSERAPLVMWGEAARGRQPVIADNNHVCVVRRQGDRKAD